MLEVLRHQNLEGVLATVVRYFGGVKLGAGGLVRAYTDCVAQALLTAEKIERQHMCHLDCSVPYAMEGWMRRELAQAGATLGLVQHHSSVRIQWQMPDSDKAAFIARLNEGGQGRIDWHAD